MEWKQKIEIQLIFIITLIWLARKSNQGNPTWPHNQIYNSPSNDIVTKILKDIYLPPIIKREGNSFSALNFDQTTDQQPTRATNQRRSQTKATTNPGNNNQQQSLNYGHSLSTWTEKGENLYIATNFTAKAPTVWWREWGGHGEPLSHSSHREILVMRESERG